MTDKCKRCFSISTEVASTISRISSQTGVPENNIVEKYLTRCISGEVELTSAERYNFRRKSINDSIDSVLRLFGILELNDSITRKFGASLYMAQGNLRGQNREYRNGIIEASLFEILENIREWDINVWKDITSHMAHFGKIRQRYFYLYPKCIKKNPRLKKDRYDTINNTITNSVTQSPQDNSVTQLKAPDSSNLSDNEYLKTGRYRKGTKKPPE